MLFSSGIIRVVATFFRRKNSPPLIADPVMVATSGTRLLKPAAIAVLQRELLPIATLITPNVPEAETLLRCKVNSVEDLRAAARELHNRFGCAALVKGGHLRGMLEAADVFFDGRNELLLSAPFVRGVRTHGTGCTYSAAITGYLALGHGLPRAVHLAKTFVTQAIVQRKGVARHSVLDPFGRRSASA
jgi:hydroxymethylpyrimidine/phosphomethylpyrimidine kinase